MVSDKEFEITARCAKPPDDGIVLFPPGEKVPAGARVLLRTVGHKRKLSLRGGSRPDPGSRGLCLSQGSIDKLGGEKVMVTAEGLPLPRAVFHDLGLAVTVILAVLTGILAVLGGVSDLSSVGPEDPSLVVTLAPILFALICFASAIALAKSVKEA